MEYNSQWAKVGILIVVNPGSPEHGQAAGYINQKGASLRFKLTRTERFQHLEAVWAEPQTAEHYDEWTETHTLKTIVGEEFVDGKKKIVYACSGGGWSLANQTLKRIFIETHGKEYHYCNLRRVFQKCAPPALTTGRAKNQPTEKENGGALTPP